MLMSDKLRKKLKAKPDSKPSAPKENTNCELCKRFSGDGEWCKTCVHYLSAPASLDECRLKDEEIKKVKSNFCSHPLADYFVDKKHILDCLLLAQLHSPKLSAYIKSREEAALTAERKKIAKVHKQTIEGEK